MTIGERIKYYRLAAGLTQQELADKIGVKLAAVSKYELGTVDNLPISRVERIADALGVTGGQIMGWEENDMIDGENLVPVVAEIAAGFDKQPIRDYEMDRFPVPSVYAKGRRTDELFIIKVRGDSMYPMYQEGDHILAVRTPTVEDGEVAILQYEDNATIKRVERVKDGLRLIPINPMYKSETVTDGDKVRVVGKPLVLIRELAEGIKT